MNSTLTPAWGLSSQWLHNDGERLRALYTWLVERMERVGLSPQKVTIDGPGWPVSKFRDFQRTRARIDQSDFGRLQRVSLTHVRPEWDGQILGFEDWTSDAVVYQKPDVPETGEAKWLVVASEANLQEQEVISHLLDFAAQCVDCYGYLFRLPREWGALVHPRGRSGNEPVRIPEEAENMGWWWQYGNKLVKGWMLRDVYTVNFLSRSYLDLSVEGTTLEKWISNDSARGTLERLNERAVTWRPPVHTIGFIREALFEAGILFYYRFFQHWEPDNPWKRDFSKPFVMPAPTPKIFRSDYRRITDPD